MQEPSSVGGLQVLSDNVIFNGLRCSTARFQLRFGGFRGDGLQGGVSDDLGVIWTRFVWLGGAVDNGFWCGRFGGLRRGSQGTLARRCWTGGLGNS